MQNTTAESQTDVIRDRRNDPMTVANLIRSCLTITASPRSVVAEGWQRFAPSFNHSQLQKQALGLINRLCYTVMVNRPLTTREGRKEATEETTIKRVRYSCTSRIAIT
jgi:hypothetical protein